MKRIIIRTFDAEPTLRSVSPDFDFEGDTDPDITSIYALTPTPVSPHYVGRAVLHRRRRIRDTRENILRLREALAAGWDIGPELAHEERRLAALEAG